MTRRRLTAANTAAELRDRRRRSWPDRTLSTPSLSDTRPASAATRSGNIDGDTTANSASRRATATSTESSHPRTRRTSSQHRRHHIRIGNRHINRGDRFDQPDNSHDHPFHQRTQR